MIIETSGGIGIRNSNFDHNAGDGLTVQSGGSVSLETVSTSHNTLTGTYINNCHYEAIDPGLCAVDDLHGTIYIFEGMFSYNGFDGIVVDAGGRIDVDQTEVNSNSVRGAILQSADEDGTGTVSVHNSDFSDNHNGTGLNVFAGEIIEVDNVTAFSNGTGATLDSTYGGESIVVTNSQFGISGDGNSLTGLHVKSGENITLSGVEASGNGTNGAHLLAEGDIVVASSTFNDNVQVGCPFEGFSNLEEVTEQNLPGPLGAGTELSTAIVLGLTDAQGNVILNEDGTVIVDFSGVFALVSP